MIRRAAPLAASALALLTSAAAGDTLAPSVGGYYALAPDTTGGWGLEASLNWLQRGPTLLPGLGVLYQYEADGARQLGGVQVFEPGYGLELGLAHRRDAGFGLHLAPFASVAVLHVAPRISLPLQESAAIEYGLLFAVKLPAPIAL